MHARQAHRLRYERELIPHPVCSHPHYEAETIMDFPTGYYVCTQCGKELSEAERLLIAILHCSPDPSLTKSL